MKKKVLLTMFIASSILALGNTETRTAYIMVPSGVSIGDIRAEGKTNDGGSFTTKGGELVADTVTGKEYFQGTGVAIKPSNMSSFDGTKYIEMAVEVDESAGAKFVAGYPVSGTSNPTYVFIAGTEIKSDSKVSSNFNNESIDLVDSIDQSDYSNYADFPGKELNEDIKFSSVMVGDSEMGSEGQVAPSNIIDIYSKPGESDVIGGNSEVSPNASDENNAFRLWAVQYVLDTNGNPVLTYDYDGDNNPIPDSGVPVVATDDEGNELRKLLYTNKSTTPAPIYDDFSQMSNIPNGQLYPLDPADDYTKDGSIWQFEIQVRFMNGSSIYVNDFKEPVKLNKTGFRWDLYNLDTVAISNEGKNPNQVKLVLGVTGDHVFIGLDEEGGYENIPPSVGETLYVVDDEGDSKEIKQGIVSKYQGVERKRTTAVNVKVFDDGLSSDHKTFNIEHINE